MFGGVLEGREASRSRVTTQSIVTIMFCLWLHAGAWSLRGLLPLFRRLSKWIPAFAGMTNFSSMSFRSENRNPDDRACPGMLLAGNVISEPTAALSVQPLINGKFHFPFVRYSTFSFRYSFYGVSA